MSKILLPLFLAVSVAACGQINKSVVKAHAYYTVQMPGTVISEDAGGGLPRNKVYILYLELKGEKPEWIRGWTDNHSFTLIPLPVGNDTAGVVVGKSLSGNEAIRFKARPGNQLVKLELALEEKSIASPKKIASNDVLLEGKKNGKRFYYKISGLTELASPEYQ